MSRFDAKDIEIERFIMRKAKLVDVGTNNDAVKISASELINRMYILYLTDDRGKDTTVLLTGEHLKEVYNEIGKVIKWVDLMLKI